MNNNISKNKEISIAILGMGTVGAGVLRLLNKNKDKITAQTGIVLNITKILLRNIEKKRDDDLEAYRSLFTDSFDDVLSLKPDIIVETMGGINPAKSYMQKALSSGCSVVTANKDVVAQYGQMLHATARENGVFFKYEASVCAGIPIIKAISESFLANKIESMMGIINGTTNYILTNMSDSHTSFAAALCEAQQKGFAESDPTNDIEGFDAARKIAILACEAFCADVCFDDVYVEGISSLSLIDIEYARELGYEIKLLGIAKNEDDGIELRVHLTMLHKNHPLSSIKNEYNAIFVEGDAVGKTMFYGKGAGSLPTASAVSGDICEVAKFISDGCKNNEIHVRNKVRVKNIDECCSQFYIRLTVFDRPGVMAELTGILGSNNVSIASIVQRRTINQYAEIVIITHSTPENGIKKSAEQFNKLDIIKEINAVLRVEE